MSDTATILCMNGGKEHHHSSVMESKVCYGLVPPLASTPAVSPAPSRPSALVVPSDPFRPVSPRQLSYIRDLGGEACAKAAKYLDRKSASALIDELLHPNKEATVTQPVTPAPAPAPRREPRPVPPEHAMIAGLLNMVPDGYYAVHEYEGGNVDFMRISRPKKNKYAGSIKVQTVMGSWMNVRVKSEPDAALWASGAFSVYDRSGQTEKKLMLLVADYQGARRRYAQKIGKCCRCNASLTDKRSRHYGIGPECEKYWPEVLEQVDMEDAIAKAEADL